MPSRNCQAFAYWFGDTPRTVSMDVARTTMRWIPRDANRAIVLGSNPLGAQSNGSCEKSGSAAERPNNRRRACVQEAGPVRTRE